MGPNGPKEWQDGQSQNKEEISCRAQTTSTKGLPIKTLFICSMTALLASAPLALAHGHFPQCPQMTNEAHLAKDMLFVVTGFEVDFSKALVGDVVGKKATIQFSSSGGRLVFDYQRNNRIRGQAYMCQKNAELRVESRSKKFGNETFVLRKRNRSSLKVSKPGVPFSTIFTVL